jgi:hypothetical protein
MGQILSAFLQIREFSERESKKSTGDSLFNNREVMNFSDSPENFGKVLEAKFDDWREKLLFCKPVPVTLIDVYGSPEHKAETTQHSLRRTNFAVFSDSAIPESFNVLYQNDLWHWWMYKGIRGQDIEKETEALGCLASHNKGDTAIMTLINDHAHIWRRGFGSFWVVGFRDESPCAVLYPVKSCHGHEYSKPTNCLAHHVVPVQPGDIVIYCSGFSVQKFTVQEMLELCRQHYDDMNTLSEKFSQLFLQRIPEIYRGYRLHVYQIKKFD